MLVPKGVAGTTGACLKDEAICGLPAQGGRRLAAFREESSVLSGTWGDPPCSQGQPEATHPHSCVPSRDLAQGESHTR